ncbi:hypothetical protein ACVWWW_001599 [Lysobacter sp. HA18]
MTTAPACANFGPYSFEMSPPAENSAMSTPVGSNVARSCTTIFRFLKSTFSPAERSLASRCSSAMGKSRSASTFSMVSPTAPVAPTTATFTGFFMCSFSLGLSRRHSGFVRDGE